ncbi:MAG: OmpA family protein [Myxococcota bacterium]|nr:OmpA family protein [Myxococcota bacterium]
MSTPLRPLSVLLGLLLASGAWLGCAAKPAVRPSEGSVSASDPKARAPSPQPEERAPQSDEESLQAAPLYFALDSSLLLPSSQEELARVAERLRRHPEVRVRIDGHTCELGTTEYNLSLGMKRAQATLDYLRRLGVDAGRMESLSLGEERPSAEGDGEEVWAKNRRSELTFSLSSLEARRE